MNLLVLLVFLAMSGCDWKRSGVENTVVLARVGESVLTEDELIRREICRPGMNEEDSTRAVYAFIQRWAKDQLLVKRAEYNLSEQQRDFDRKVEDYRRDLMIFAYKQAYLKENIDTLFNQDVINAFYTDNKDMFLLRENIYRIDYVSLPIDAPSLDELEKLFFQGSDLDDFAEKVFPFAHLLSVGDTSWLTFADVTGFMPVVSDAESDFISRKKSMKYQDDEFVYWVALNEVKLKETDAPVEFVESSIRSILLNQRKRSTLKALEEKLLNDGIKKNQVEIYN